MYILKKKLYEIYGKEICIHGSKGGPIISFLNTGLKKILNEQWYKRKEEDEENERKRIVKTALLLTQAYIR